MRRLIAMMMFILSGISLLLSLIGLYAIIESYNHYAGDPMGRDAKGFLSLFWFVFITAGITSPITYFIGKRQLNKTLSK